MNPLQMYSGQGIGQKTGKKLGQTTGKYFDRHVNDDAQKPEKVISKGKRGGSRISKLISMDTETYHRTKGK